MENNALSPASQRYALSGTSPPPDHAGAYAALASMADAVYCVDTVGCFTFANTAFEAMTGYALADLRGTPSTRLYVPEAEALFTERRRQVYSGAAVSPYAETVLILQDGRRLPVELSVSSLILEGEIAGRVVVLRDITARRQSEKQRIRERVDHTLTEWRQAHALLGTLFATAPVGLGFLDRGLRFVRVNDRLAEINGLPAAAHLGKTPTELLPGIEHLEQIMADWGQVMATGKPMLHVEVSGETPAAPGQRRYWREHFFPVSMDGEVIGLGAVVEEITAQKQAEEELRTSEARYRATFAGAPVGIAHVGLDGRFLRFNDAVCTITGYPREALATLTFSDITHPDDLETDGAQRRRMCAGEIGTYLREKRYLRKDGVIVWVNLTVSLLRDSAGEPLHFISVIENITERKQAEDMRQHLAAIIESSDDAIIGKTLEGLITSWNQGAQRLYGYTAQEVLGKSVSVLVPPDLIDEFPQILERLKGGESIDRYETQRLHKDGTRLDVSLTISPIRGASGRLIGASAIARDITEHKHAENERRRLEARLRRVEKLEAIGTLAGGIAHEFNNILAGLLGFATLLQREVPPESRTGSYVQQVRQAGQRAKELVQQIVTFSRAERTSKEPLQLDQVVHEALTLLRASLPSTIDIQYRPSEPGVIVHASRTQLHGVVMNLGANADHAMRETGGRLTVGVDPVEIDAAFATAHPPLSPGPHVRLTMDDTGRGMTPEVMGRIFEPFFTTKASGEGTGLGLAIVHGIVTSHRGAITVASTRGAGTQFAIYLPRLEASAVQDADSELSLPHGHGAVLVVDDEETVALALRLLLESLGYDAVVHTTSRDALKAFRTAPHRFDVVITDQTMPQMTGEDLVHALRRIRPDIPIILCTGFSHIMDAEKAQVLGNVTFLMKPVDEHDLAVRLQQVLAPNPAKTSSALRSA